MEASQLLLGRPWQYDRDVAHNGVTNKFSFVHKGQKVTLKPLSPSEICEDQIKIRVKREKQRKGEKSKIDKKKKKRQRNMKGEKIKKRMEIKKE